ncbi:MAG TPA: hypothetical protein VIV83_03750 [Gemmatimonadales bacterium]|jgi:hypothetical protein
MTTSRWRRIAGVLSALNVAGAGFALASGEFLHAMAHASLAFLFGFVAWRRPQVLQGGELADVQQQLDDHAAALEDAQRQLVEMQERMDFAERMLAQARERNALTDRDKRA